jgi:acyl-CoA thioesterase FadM
VWDYVAARTTIEYRNEVTQADRYVVGTASVVSVGKTSVTTKIALQTPTGRLAADVEIVTVAVDRETRRPRPLTDDERGALLDSRPISP